MTTNANNGINDLRGATCQPLASLFDAGLVQIEQAAAALNIEPKRLRGYVWRNSLRDPIGDANFVYGWSCRELAERLAVSSTSTAAVE